MVFGHRMVVRARMRSGNDAIGALGTGENHPRHVADHRCLQHVQGAAQIDIENKLGIGAPLRVTDQRRQVDDGLRFAGMHQPRQQRAVTDVTHQQFILAAQVRHQRVVCGVVKRRHRITALQQVAHHPAPVDAAASGNENPRAHQSGSWRAPWRNTAYGIMSRPHAIAPWHRGRITT